MQSLIVVGMIVATCCDANQDDRFVEASFDDLGMDTRSMDHIDLDSLPDRISSLNGKAIRIRGYIYGPSMASTTESTFVLVRDALEFSPWPQCNNIAVTMGGDSQIDYTVRPVTIVGTFKVTKRKKLPNSELTIFYHLSDAKLAKH